ncbi:MAG: hypothetical protein ABSH56_01190 [Bryobacteraceae bacterium]
MATFFEGSVESAVAALIESQSARLGAEDFERIAGIVEQAKKERATVAGGKPWLPWLWWLGCAAVCGRFLAGAARKATLQARGPRHAICSSARR